MRTSKRRSSALRFIRQGVVEGRNTLSRLARVPIQTWNYTNDTAKTPTSARWRRISTPPSAWAVGKNNPASSPRLLRATVDADGVALAAIQGLHQIVKEKETEIESLKTRLAALEKLFASLVEKREVAAK